MAEAEQHHQSTSPAELEQSRRSLMEAIAGLGEEGFRARQRRMAGHEREHAEQIWAQRAPAMAGSPSNPQATVSKGQ